MPSFLVFSLWAPLAALGDLAVGERRYGIDRPGKSAVFGLLAAALGIKRGDEADHQALNADFGYAVRVEAPGTLLTDYHTTQTQAARKNRHWATRRQELAAPGWELETILSSREYRCDARFLVAVWPRPRAGRTLGALAEALRKPYFTLYLGRKACPLGVPPQPLVVEQPDLAAAFQAYTACHPGKPERLFATKGAVGAGTIHADTDAVANGWLRPDLHTVRRDQVVSRRRWQFGLRSEAVALGAMPSGQDTGGQP